MDTTQQPGILIGQIFLERAMFSHREDALILPVDTPLGRPNLALNFQGGVAPDGKAGFVRITVQSKPEDRPLYNLDVTMTVLVQVEEGKGNMPLEEYVRASGLAALYPFVREAVANLTGRGRFGPLWLNPINVAAVTSKAPTEVTPAEAETSLSLRRRPAPRGRDGARKKAKK